MSMFLLDSPAAWLLWFIVLAVAMYFARLPAHRAILSLTRAVHQSTRLAAQSLRLAEQKLAARNREVLLAAGREAKERIIEREFALSGSEQNPDLTERSIKLVLGRIGKGAPEPVKRFMERGVDFVIRKTLPELVALATKYRIPGAYGFREFVDEGGFMALGPSYPDLYRRAASYVDKILKGKKPAELPVEQPSKFEFILNLKTAKGLGLTVPPTLILCADEVIE